MNKNINNDINKFDGKYLKCIVSKHKSVTNYLANSGSMIILQEAQGDFNRNSIYLGDAFVASGYGFKSEEYKNIGERIVEDYDDDIKELKSKISAEEKSRQNSDNAINRKFNEYVLIKGGPIENTIINLDNCKIPTRDIILYGEEAKYDNLEIIDLTITLHGNKLSELNRKFHNENILLCPIGAKINDLAIDITTNDNDSGGLSNLVVLHNQNFLSDYGNLSEDIEAVMIDYNCDYDYNLNDENGFKYTYHKWYYTKKFNGQIVDKYLKNAIKGIYLYVKGTPLSGYKYYPGLLRKNSNWKVLSSGNAIKDNRIDINRYIDIKPQYYAKWIIGESFNASNYNYTDDNCIGLNNTDDYAITEITIDIIDNKNSVYIAIPKNFSVQKIYIIDNHTNKYNWTGAVKIQRNTILPCSYSEMTSEGKYPCILYDIYCLESNVDLKVNTQVNVVVSYNSTASLYGDDIINPLIYKTQNEILNQITITHADDSINDEEFNNIYWINGNITNTYELNELKELLNKTSENGLVTN